ncbi:hypothetical protein C8F04DRAFT_1263939 [Mycena alexandri]|uniref:CxC2-like cysteine cluster KDZ transposase-associated domain-containing protein n=1 Tax=Mycena alexandri TaxID=1745969 RepID=A0AAD6SNW1_9AGAR|nr:hypothetical protein C8F04DRAFT_1263939 [Mycena alexandri]
MPVMQGPNLANDEVLEIYMGIESILDQVRWQVRGSTVCECGQPAYLHCNDCGPRDFCQQCLVAAHAAHPFHDVRAWSESLSYYTHTTFYHLGLRLQLGHSGEPCPTPRLERREAVTLRGIKTVAIDFCACPDGPSEYDQIKAHGWWPMRSNFICALPLRVLPIASAATANQTSHSDDSDSDDSDDSDSDNDDNENLLAASESESGSEAGGNEGSTSA